MGTKCLTWSLVLWKHFLLMMAKAYRGPAMPQALFLVLGLLKSTIHIPGSASQIQPTMDLKYFF